MKTCNNCDYQPQTAHEDFCAQCGQKYHLHLHSFKDTVLHFIADYFHFDNKLWKTILKLFQNCGKLSEEYINGKVASNYNPLSLYIFISAVFFMIYFSMVQYSYNLIKERPSEYHESLQWNSFQTLELNSNEYKDSIYVSPDSARQLMPILLEDYQFELMEDSKTYYLGARLIGAIRGLQHKPVFSLGNAITYFTNSFIKDIPKLFFAFVPLLALFFRLFIRKRTYMECLIFAVYFQCLLFLLILIAALLEALAHFSYAASTSLLLGTMLFMLTQSIQYFGKKKRIGAILSSFFILVIYYGSLCFLSLVYLHIKAFYL
ncbi:MAG: DUF3667 domain-containing protein [Chitinophagaceae bacterium]|nr:DUF3667 domain-containing protein [Chitinophagaceae bacterium]